MVIKQRCRVSELRDLSTRATITPVSFANEYNWGDFKGDPDKLMQRYFEACRAMVDISEAYALYATQKQFQKELKEFMAGHMQRKALIQHLVKAGIWKDQ
jgi:hypothetical protein